MSDATDTEAETVWRNRWDVCDSCGCSTSIANEDSPDGVPEPVEWEEFAVCLVCGGTLTMGNAEDVTPAQAEYESRRELLLSVGASWAKRVRDNAATIEAFAAPGKTAELIAYLLELDPS